jgi:hypothetical protein
MNLEMTRLLPYFLCELFMKVMNYFPTFMVIEIIRSNTLHTIFIGNDVLHPRVRPSKILVKLDK